MSQPNEPVRDRLLSRIPQPDELPEYKKAMASLVEAKERALKREKWQTNALWIFLVLLSTVFLYIGSQRINTPGGTWFGIQACFWFMAGTVYLMKHFINQLTVQVLKETKQLQVQVLELRAMLGDGGKRN